MNLWITLGLASLHATTLHQFMEELLDASILMHYGIVQEHTVERPNFLHKSCITLCKTLALLYARFLHYLCKNLDLKILQCSCKNVEGILCKKLEPGQDSCKSAWLITRNYIFLQQGNHHNLARYCIEALIFNSWSAWTMSILGLHI